MATSNTPVGTVQFVQNQVQALNVSGELRTLTLDSPVYFEDTIMTGADGLVSISLQNGDRFDLGRNGQAVLDSDVVGRDPAASAAEAVLEAEAIQQALLAGGDNVEDILNQINELEATAAGAGDNETSDSADAPVVIDRTGAVGQVTAGYPTIAPSREFPEVLDEILGAEPVVLTVVEPPVEPPAPVDLRPVANDDVFTVNEYQTLEGSVTENDLESGDGVHTYRLLDSGETIPGLTFNDDGSFTYLASGVEGDSSVTFNYEIVDADGDADPAKVTINIQDVVDPGPEDNFVGEWFIAHGDNHDRGNVPDFTVESYANHNSIELNIQNRQLGDYRIDQDDAVTFKFDLWGKEGADLSTVHEDYDLNIVSKSPHIDIEDWSLSGNELTVMISADRDGVNLSGSTFAIEVTALGDELAKKAVEGVDYEVLHTSLGFDLSSVVHYDASAEQAVLHGQWESNDDILLDIASAYEFVPPLDDVA